MMRERITARVLLFDPQDRVLLMKGRLPSNPEAPGVWFTVGGGAEPGESVLEAAARELAEETGFSDCRLGAVIWYREVILELGRGEPVLFKESYVTARCSGGEPSRAGWQAVEKSLIDDIRWWSADEMRLASGETFYPEGFADLLPEALSDPRPVAPRLLSPSADTRKTVAK